MGRIMNTLTDEKVIDEVSALIPKLTGISYILVMEDKGKISLVKRQNQPCYGEMRVYDPNLRDKPSDLNSPFPKGTPIGVGLRFHVEMSKSYSDCIFSEISPYRNLMFSGKEPKIRLVKNGVIFLDTKVDSDLLVHFCIYNRAPPQSFKSFVDSGIDPRIAFILAEFCYERFRNYFIPSYKINSYTMPLRLSFKALYTGVHTPLEPDYLFFDRKPYHRNSIGDLNDIWKGDDSLIDLRIKYE